MCVCVCVFLQFVVNSRHIKPHRKQQYKEGAAELCGRVGKALMPMVVGAVPKDT